MPRGRNDDDRGTDQNDLSESNTEVHPTVSMLLGSVSSAGFARSFSDPFRYDRDEMIRLSKVPLSVTRPSFLGMEFNGDDGKFSPFKWLEHKWEVDGLNHRTHNRPKKVDALKLEASEGESAVLSPQRRGFSGGCCPPEDKNGDGGGNKKGGWSEKNGRWNEKGEKQMDEKRKGGWTSVEADDRKFGARNKQNWRDGADGDKKSDFKLPFQKSAAADNKTRSAGGSSNSWRTAGGDSKDFRPQFGRKEGFNGRGRNQNSQGDEKLPEWAEDGPTTIDDMIELRGFDEPNNKRKNKKAQDKEKQQQKEKELREPAVSKEIKEKINSVVESPAEKLDIAATGELSESANVILQKGLPETDAEFAAILGLLDMAPEKTNNIVKNETQTQKDDGSRVTGSRLSRFFKRDAGESSKVVPSPIGAPVSSSVSQNTNTTMMNTNQDNNPLLAKIFAQSHSSSGNGSPLPQASHQRMGQSFSHSVRGGMSLEELERGIHRHGQQENVPEPPRPSQKGGILNDPFEHASLMQKLQRMARAQENSSPHNGSPPPGPGGLPPMPTHQRPHMPPPLPQIHNNDNAPQIPGSSSVPAPQLILMHQFYQAAMVQATNACGGIPPPHVVEQIRQLAVRQAIMHTQKAALIQAAVAQQAQQQTRLPQTTSLIPASVQRHMKAATSHSEEKKDNMEKHMHVMPHPDEETAAKNAAVMHKMSSQAAYHAMMSAMQGGLPMASWRQQQANIQQPPPVPQQPNPQIALLQQQMLLAQAHAQQQQLLHLRAKAMMQQQKNMHMHNGGGDRVHPAPIDDLSGPMQNPLEKLLAAAGVQPTQRQHMMEDCGPPSDPAPSILSRLPASARPMSLEELERKLTESH